jgi:hypothetical protein
MKYAILQLNALMAPHRCTILTKALFIVIAIEAASLLFRSRHPNEPLKHELQGHARASILCRDAVNIPTRSTQIDSRHDWPTDDAVNVLSTHDTRVAKYNIMTHLDSTLLEGWTRVVQDWLLPFYPEITSLDIDDTFRLDHGKKVVFQHIKGKIYVLDPATYCSAPPPDMLYFKNRCHAIYSILKETSARTYGNLPDFEFVYDFNDFPSYRSHNKSMNHKPMPGFGSVRCWQKGFMSFPMFGSHGRWDINAIDDKIASILGRQPTPFAERKSTAVFRGGLRSCSFPPEHNDMLDWRLQDFKDFYKGKRCGRDQLQVISQGHPNLVDFRNTDGGAGMQSMVR